MSVVPNSTPPLPISWEECKKRGWTALDILLITGDAYIDHPSFGIALIGRLLESKGYRVAILPQPRVDSTKDFSSFPTPLLFCGISAGNLDSIVANYSSNGKVREKDSYSKDGNPWRGDVKQKKERKRPDRATLIYTNLARAAFGKIPLVLGGLEASLRRFVHFDYKQNRLRDSILVDAKGDLLVYGMGERQVLELAKRCRNKKRDLSSIAGTCLRLTDKEFEAKFGTLEVVSSREMLVLPSSTKIQNNTAQFLDSEVQLDKHQRAYSPRLVVQRQKNHWVVQHPSPHPLSQDELDQLYELPFTRKPHPADQNIPAYHMIKDSVTIVRGCSGNCSFCAISRHQGAQISSRSVGSVVRECSRIANDKSFRGTISDLGGPTANLFGTDCTIGGCKKRDCLFPKLCPNLEIDEEVFLNLLQEVTAIENIDNVFISSGLRMELLLKTPQLLKRLLTSHTPGLLKIAPEHTDDKLLHLMHKESHDLLKKFVSEFRKISVSSSRKKIALSPYVITSHPGSTPECAKKLATDLKKLGLTIDKFQDFTPTPGTLSTAMYVTGLEPESRKKIPVPRNSSQRKEERKIIETSFHKKRHHRKRRK